MALVALMALMVAMLNLNLRDLGLWGSAHRPAAVRMSCRVIMVMGMHTRLTRYHSDHSSVVTSPSSSCAHRDSSVGYCYRVVRVKMSSYRVVNLSYCRGGGGGGD